MSLTTSISFGVSKEDEGLVILESRERYLKRAIPRCASGHVSKWQSLPFLLCLRISHENKIVRNKTVRFPSQPQNKIPPNITGYTRLEKYWISTSDLLESTSLTSHVM